MIKLTTFCSELKQSIHKQLHWFAQTSSYISDAHLTCRRHRNNHVEVTALGSFAIDLEFNIEVSKDFTARVNSALSLMRSHLHQTPCTIVVHKASC